MAKWLRQRFAKPLFPSSNLGGASKKIDKMWLNDIIGPDAVQVFIEKPAEPEAINRVVNEAVYACAFIGR